MSSKSIPTIPSENNILVYPNPAEDYTTVAITNFSNNEDVVTCTVSNISGEILKQVNSFTPNITIEMEDLETGIYLLEIQTGLQKEIRKLIKK